MAAHRLLQGDVLDDGPLDITDGDKTLEVFTAEHEQYLHLHLVPLLHCVEKRCGGGDDAIFIISIISFDISAFISFSYNGTLKRSPSSSLKDTGLYGVHPPPGANVNSATYK